MTAKPEPTPEEIATERAALVELLTRDGFTIEQAEGFLTGPPAETRRQPPRFDNKGKTEGPLMGGGGTGRHTGTRGSVDGDRT